MKSKQPKKKPLPKSGRESRPLRVLLVEDSVLDAEILVRHLESFGYDVQHQRVENAAAMEEALSHGPWDLVLCDYMMPDFAVAPAIDLLKKKKLDLPFIVVSGTAGEKVAVEVMKAGAHDFIAKDNLTRLAPAIERELREAKVRAHRASDIEKLFYLAAIVDSTGEAIISQNMEGTITTWNAGARQLFGYTEAEAVGQSIFLITPENLRSDRAEIFEKLRAGEPVEPFETVRVRKDGVPVDVYLALSPIKSADGRLVGASSIAYDITERKKIEDERTKMIQQLNDTLSKVRTLSGLLPICANCKKIRDDHGYWQKLETFVHEHSNAEFSHSICPDCMEKLYPDFSKKKE
jgi:two-component system, cell cycle sensor histidine kinase and response regulator CckA